MADSSLAGSVAVVTGAGRGIGRAIAVGYAHAGAKVCCAARSRDQIDETVRHIVAFGGDAISVAADVTDYVSSERLFDQAAARFGGIDIVVLNAGAAEENRLVEESDPAAWKLTIEVNLIGAFHTAKAAIPHLRRRGGGKMIIMGSGMGHRSGPTRSAYASSKAGLWMLTRILAQELLQHDISVNELIPGPVLTEFIKGREEAIRKASNYTENLKSPDDVVPLALFLASQLKGGPTGQSFSLARREL